MRSDIHPCPDDFAVFDTAEGQVHVRACADCRAAWAAAGALREDFTVRPGDERMIRRVALELSGPRRTRPGISRVMARAAVIWPLLLVVGGAATASVLLGVRSRGRARNVASDSGRSLAEQRVRPRAHRTLALPEAPSPIAELEPNPSRDPPEVVPVSEPAVQKPLLAPRSSHAKPVPRVVTDQAPSPATAEALLPGDFLAAANRKRRLGARAEAAMLYQRLQRQHPGAPETEVSFLSLAELHVEEGEFVKALAAFDDYLRVARSGLLVEEALSGRARCLGALGRVEEGRAAWRDLLARFPNSVHAPVARARLGPSP